MSEGVLSIEQQRKIDTILNKTVLDLAVYSTIGYAFGLGVGFFFKNKQVVRNALAGVGGSYGFVLNKHSLRQV